MKLSSLEVDGDKLDNFYKSLLFQELMDIAEVDKNERSILLVIFRKTLHYDKWWDSLGIYWLSKDTEIGKQKVRETINSLEDKRLIRVERSKGGRSDGIKKFHRFALHGDLLMKVYEKWLKIREELPQKEKDSQGWS